MKSITCPKCQHVETKSTHICSKCGAKLIPEEGSSTLNFPAIDLNSLDSKLEESPLPKTIPPSIAQKSLMILRTGEIIPLMDKKEFVIGRVGGKQTIYPDIDLSAYTGYASGVSRLHATIMEQNGKIYIYDLGSTNGTQVNHKRLTANENYQLHNGDRILFGGLEIMFINEEDSF